MLPKKVTKSKIGSKGFNLTEKSCSDNIAARNSKTKCYKELHLSRCGGGHSTGVASIFMRGVVIAVYITKNCNNRNYYYI